MLKILLVGAGRISSKHIEAISKFSTIATIVGVVEIDIKKHLALQNEHNFKSFSDLDVAISDTSPDVAVILTDSGSHFNVARKLCGKVKHVLVEKPMALNLRAAESLVKMYNASATTLSCVKQNRYNSAIQYMKRKLDDPAFGPLNLSAVKLRWCRTQQYYDQAHWRGKWASDGGVISNQAIHHLDLQQWFMGDFESVIAYSATFGSSIEVEDSLVAIIKFKNGAIGTIEATTAARPANVEASISVLGGSASIQVGGFAANKVDYCTLGKTSQEIVNENLSASDIYGTGHVKMYDEYLKKIIQAEVYEVSGAEAIKSIKLINALYKSIEEKREVFGKENCASNILGKNDTLWQ